MLLITLLMFRAHDNVGKVVVSVSVRENIAEIKHDKSRQVLGDQVAAHMSDP